MDINKKSEEKVRASLHCTPHSHPTHPHTERHTHCLGMQAGEGGLRGGSGKIRKGILVTYQRGTQHATDLVAKVGNLSWAKGNTGEHTSQLDRACGH